ncbi:YfiT family bacillithiol transferase [Euzebyella saccharophila]|uniref:YfiT family bacillithiol transferase n=1 Tax=Euzebyella saccharophila TaxID=679664 RepID=A0ABV8JJ81_9FLAO|nr:putative metal-dependent hydrolase [Euzebyella saccharophila]
MEEHELYQLKYPIGTFEVPEVITDDILNEWIIILEKIPNRLKILVEGLSESQLETPYRPGGWTVRQTVHHIADSHHNSYLRFKWALTENSPVIKAYDEKEWSKLFDAKTAPIELSLTHLSAVHAKLVYLLRGLSRESLKRIFIHPEGRVETSLDENVGRYAWHGQHHYTQIENLLKREGWL